jgi:hypothetical protein
MAGLDRPYACKRNSTSERITRVPGAGRSTMRWLVLAATLAAAFMASPADAQSPAPGPFDIPCQESALFLSATMSCLGRTGLEGQDVGAVQDVIATVGLTEGALVSMTLFQAKHQTYFPPYADRESVEIIKRTGEMLRQPTSDWSDIATDADTSYMTFQAGGMNCIGFDHAGPLIHGGYAWLLRGIVCPTGGRTATLSLLKNYLAATRIGSASENRNVFGKPVTALPTSSGHNSQPNQTELPAAPAASINRPGHST